MGFTCKWENISKALDVGLGPMASVKRLSSYFSDRNYMQGGLTVLDMFYKINQFVDKNKGLKMVHQKMI